VVSDEDQSYAILIIVLLVLEQMYLTCKVERMEDEEKVKTHYLSLQGVDLDRWVASRNYHLWIFIRKAVLCGSVIFLN
jgi:hypothetical protein